MIRGWILAAVQVAMILSIGGKLLLDRSTLPRIWVKTAPFDPNLPIRGRYVNLLVEVDARGFGPNVLYGPAHLAIEDGKLVAVSDESGNVPVTINNGRARLSQGVPYFIPDPSRRPPGEELWVEVTIPPKGSPRPIRLGAKRNGVLTPLDVK